MNLKSYNKKRKFSQTPEPVGEKQEIPSGPLRFVVQKHQASHLHYDIRLELDGTLLSWAVPKGPSMNPLDKRLAMMVEDHPLSYRNFEGIIPAGNYGAGTVMVWDEGFYTSRQTADPKESRQVLRAGLKKGHLTFVLIGTKLKGEFALVKIQAGSRAQRSSNENLWLLIKAGDEYAASEDVLKKNRSAATGRTMEEIARRAEEKGEIWQSNTAKRPPKVETAGIPSPMPQVRPMMATAVTEPFDRDGWLFEIKWDGFRAIAETGSFPRLYSRNLLSFETRFPPVFNELKKLKFQAILDGEIVAMGEKDLPSFQKLQDYGNNNANLAYYVFDILFLNGKKLYNLPLRERKSILKELIQPANKIIRFSDHVEVEGWNFFRVAERQGLEGIMAKDAESAYLPGKRTTSWLKIKARKSQEVVITGFTEPRGSRQKFGSLVLGIYRNKKLTYAGHTGSGFDEKTLDILYRRLKPLQRERSPFDPVPKTNMPVTWVKPALVAEVNYTEWTSDGRLRHPIYKGLRPDKNPPETEPEEPMRKNSEEIIKAGNRKISVTNLNKVYWPAEKYTKGDLIEYYRKVKKLVLPHLKDRPQTLHRFPNGIEGSSFYQKDMKQVADWVKTARVDHGGKIVNYLLVQDEPGLIYLANLGCIEIHPFSSRVRRLNNPDYLAIDLDPEEVGFDRVRETALMVHELLDEIGAINFCKTSGATGLHVYIPLGAKYNYDQTKQFGKILATIGNRRLPSVTSIIRSPAKRRGKVYLDYLQNNPGQTLASVYSLRPLPGAPVSTPLEWKEVKKKFEPADFNIKTAVKRFQKTGDLFKPVLGKGVNLSACLSRLEKLV